MAIKTKDGTVGLELDRYNYFSVIPVIEYNDGKFVSLKLFPIELGFNESNLYKGLPARSDAVCSALICEHLNKISSEYGTKFELQEGNVINVWNCRHD